MNEATENPKTKIELLEDQLRERASRAYCDYIDQLRKTECLGWEQKVKSGKFGEPELLAHKRAYELFGKHVGYNDALKMLKEIAALDPWISVEDGLPEEEGRYLTIIQKPHLKPVPRMSSFISYFGGKPNWTGLPSGQHSVTHWMKIPPMVEPK